MQQTSKNKIYYLSFSFIVLFFSCSSLTNKKGNQHIIVLVESVYIENVINNDSLPPENKSKNVESVIALFSRQKDTITTYTFNLADLTQSSFKNQFISKKVNATNRIFLASFNRDTTSVKFETNNRIVIDNDIYTVNNPYYTFLKKRIIEDGCILDFINLIKDGYGDYYPLFSPLLDYTWDKNIKNTNYKILRVNVKNVDYQTSNSSFDIWEVKYENDNATSERFKKYYIKEDDSYRIFKTEYDNERFQISKMIFENKKTLLDSTSASWEAYSQSMSKYQIDYQKYQSKLEVVKTNKTPKDLNEIIELLNNAKE